MEVSKEDSRQTVEPQFLSQASAGGIKIHIGQMNRAEHEGIIRDIGRYELNLEVNGSLITLLKQDIAYFTAPAPILTVPQPRAVGTEQEPSPASGEAAAGRPNIQHEFLDKAIKDNHLLTLYLVNGQRMKAYITAYDSFTILVHEGGRQHLFYKHAITTINR